MIGKKMSEYENVPENDVLELLDETSIARRLANMTLHGEQKSKFARKLRK